MSAMAYAVGKEPARINIYQQGTGGENDENKKRSLKLLYHAEVYYELGFEKILIKYGFTENVDLHKAIVQGSSKLNVRVQQLIDKFEKSIVSKTLNFNDKPDLSDLIFNEQGNAHDEVRAYLEKVKAQYHIAIYKNKRDIPCCQICSLDDSICNEVYRHIESAFNEHKIDEQVIQRRQQLTDFIEQWEMKKKLKVIRKSSKSHKGLIYCTRDLSSELVKHISAPEHDTIQVANHYMEYLQIFGKTLLSDEAEKYKVRADLDFKYNTLTLEGNKEDTKRFKTYFETFLQKDNLFISKSDSLNTALPYFDEIAKGKECSWSIRRVDQPTDNLQKGFEHLSTFYHPVYPGTLSCITGNTSELNVDGLILLVTDKLCSLHRFNESDKSLYDVCTESLDEQTEGHFLGECNFKQTLSKPCSSVLRVIVEYANSHIPSGRGSLSNYFINALKRAADAKVKSVCLPVSMMMGNYCIEEVVKMFVDVLVDRKFEESAVQYFLCFDPTFPNQNNILKEVEKTFVSADRGFSCRNYGQTKKREAGVSEVKIHHLPTSLQLTHTEAIVNTTRVDFNLTKGFVSSSLLNAAGEDLHKFCSAKYPNGISSDEVAVTPPFKLKDYNKDLKYVFHGVLPQFEVTTFQTDVKRFMRLCLHKAEEKKCKTVAFPLLGTGNHGNPTRETMKAMFDAVEEYGIDSIKPRVETVVFAIPGDEDSKVFHNEEKRRSKEGRCISYLPRSFADFLEGTISKGNRHVVIRIGTENECKEVPSYTVDVHFRTDMSRTSLLKYANENPCSVHDQLSIKIGNSNSDLEQVKMAIQSCLAACKEHRITEISLDWIKARTMKIADYYQAVTDEVKIFVKTSSKDQFYIQKINITVTENEFTILENHFLHQSTGFMSRFSGPSVVWQKHDGNTADRPVQIQILGKSKDSVSLVKKEMSNALDMGTNVGKDTLDQTSSSTTYKDLGARPKQINASASGNTHRTSADDDENVDTDDDDDYADIFLGNVSANINSGFISFKTEHKDLDRWLTKVRKEFFVHVNESSNKQYVVTGAYRWVSRFQCYLDRHFPEDPSIGVIHEIKEYLKKKCMTKLKEPSILNDAHEVDIEIPELEANALMALYKHTAINGVKHWKYIESKKAIHVIVQLRGLSTVEDEIKTKVSDLCKEECNFIDDQNQFMLAEAACIELQSNQSGLVYHKLVPQESKIIIIGKDRLSVQGIVNKLHSNSKMIDDRVNSSIREHSSGSNIDSAGYDEKPFSLKSRNFAVKIYRGNINNLAVDVIALPANKSVDTIRGLQSSILQEAGQVVIDEYKSLFSQNKTMGNGECKITSAGNLRYKLLLHVYLQQRGKAGELHIPQIAQLKQVLTTCFKTADREGHCSIGLPFIGAGNAGYPIDICAQEYFRAISTTDWKPHHLQQIHFVSVDEGQVNRVKRIFEKCVHDVNSNNKNEGLPRIGGKPIQESQGNGLSSSFNRKQPLVLGKNNLVKLYVDQGCVSAFQVDVIACQQNTYFTNNHGLAKRVHDLLGDTGKKYLQAERGTKHIDSTVHVVSASSSDLTCKTVFYIVLSKTLQVGFEKTLEDATFSLLNKAEDSNYQSMALPLLWIEEAELHICCKAMVKGIYKHVYNSHRPLKEIHVLNEDPFVVQKFRKAIQDMQNII